MDRLIKVVAGVSALLCLAGGAVTAQVLNCKVRVDPGSVQATDLTLIQDMERNFADFLNDTAWSEDEFKPYERIHCNLGVQLDPNGTNVSQGTFQASVEIISSRPVLGSTYETIVFYHGDRDWNFEYNAGQPLRYNSNAFRDNITSLLSFYALIIVGYDYDTFGELSGDPYFKEARQVVLNAETSGYKGWNQSNNSQNRYWITRELTDPKMESLRKQMYAIHIRCLDNFVEDPERARVQIHDALKIIRDFGISNRRSLWVSTFMRAKTSELRKIYSKGPISLRKEVYNTVVQINPTLKDDFEQILN